MVKNKEQFGFYGLDIKGITIHNTGNDLSAYQNYEYMENTTGSNGTHFLIDENEIIQAMPLDWCVYHTGMGIDWACKHTIAIEICRSTNNELYKIAEQRAVDFIKNLMEEYGLTTSNLYFHKDFRAKTYCPHRILDTDKTKKAWVERWF